jgi:hypothetical protein
MTPIEQIQQIDLTAYREARRLAWKRDTADREAREGLDKASRKAASALRKRATSLVDPHFIEWMGPSDALSINHTDWTVRPHFSGHIQPRNKGLYTRWARATIQFSITCRDMDEFDEVFRGLKAAADALAETLYGKKT